VKVRTTNEQLRILRAILFNRLSWLITAADPTAASVRGLVRGLGVAQSAAFYLEERFGAGVLNPGRWAKFTLPGGANDRSPDRAAIGTGSDVGAQLRQHPQGPWKTTAESSG
jgi:hypothetical protein